MKVFKLGLVSCFVVICSVGFFGLSEILGEENSAVPEQEEAVVEEVVSQVLSVKEFALCEGVEDRNPVNQGSSFSSGIGRIYLWTNIYGAEEPTHIYHVWYYGEQEMAVTKLDIKYSRNRTWSSKTIMPQWVGNWKVEVVDAEGNMLQEVSFVTTSPSVEKSDEKQNSGVQEETEK